MSEVTRLLAAIDAGNPDAAASLFPLVYDELRRLAASRMASEKPGHTLQPTALVHEAYLRLVDTNKVPHWQNRGHFFAAAAQAMRRILIDTARRKLADKRGGDRSRVPLDDNDPIANSQPEQFLAVDDALTRLTELDPVAGKLVLLRYYAGLSVEQAGESVGVSTATAYRHWTFARAWLHSHLLEQGDEPR